MKLPLLAPVAGLALLALPALAAGPAPALPQIGKKAPNFSLPANDGKTYSLKQMRGHWLVLAFYPADFTGG